VPISTNIDGQQPKGDAEPKPKAADAIAPADIPEFAALKTMKLKQLNELGAQLGLAVAFKTKKDAIAAIEEKRPQS